MLEVSRKWYPSQEDICDTRGKEGKGEANKTCGCNATRVQLRAMERFQNVLDTSDGQADYTVVTVSPGLIGQEEQYNNKRNACN